MMERKVFLIRPLKREKKSSLRSFKLRHESKMIILENAGKKKSLCQERGEREMKEGNRGGKGILQKGLRGHIGNLKKGQVSSDRNGRGLGG